MCVHCVCVYVCTFSASVLIPDTEHIYCEYLKYTLTSFP